MPAAEPLDYTSTAKTVRALYVLVEELDKPAGSENSVDGVEVDELYGLIARLLLRITTLDVLSWRTNPQGLQKEVAAPKLMECSRPDGERVRLPTWRCLFDRLTQLASSGWLHESPLSELLLRPEDDRRLLGLGLSDEALAKLLDALAFEEIGPRAPEIIGELYESLLNYRLRRLKSTAVCMKANRRWIELSEILAEPAELRAKWLERMAQLSKKALIALRAPLARAKTVDQVAVELRRYCVGRAREAGSLVLEPSTGRRKSGSHYTPKAICDRTVTATLLPLVQELDSEGAILALRICDPAMGSGAFLLAVARYLTTHILTLRSGQGDLAGEQSSVLRDVVSSCLFGVDKDPFAVLLARLSLCLLSLERGKPALKLDSHLLHGDALVGLPTHFSAPERTAPAGCMHEALFTTHSALHWPEAFAPVFAGHSPGFHAIVGNPPWIAYVGRAAQPLSADLAEYYLSASTAFAGYRTLHGLFVHRAACLLREGGRLGLVLPTSVSDLEGYRATRRAHDALCKPDGALPDFGDGQFQGVFQPCMALLSTRQSGLHDAPSGAPWPLERSDLSPVAAALLARLQVLPRLPHELFGERGFQTAGSDQAHLRQQAGPEAPFDVALREGTDVREFCLLPPRLFANAKQIGARLRSRADWQAVRILIRQTARYPIATFSDGLAFRNSVLAGFALPSHSEYFLVCYLNSTLIRWYHFVSQRDARQGMPQLKVGHLRELPAPPTPGLLDTLDRLGRQIANGRRAAEQIELINEAVLAAFRISATEREELDRWARHNPVPKQRAKARVAAESPRAGPSARETRQSPSN